MRIKECYIENFGKLHQYKKTFSDTLDVTVSDNGWGKTTFTLFLRAMLFGMESKRAKNSIREKFRPWQGGKYGGYIVFEANGKSYRAERYFNDTESKDTFTLYDCENGMISDDYPEDIGVMLLHTDRETFAKTAYIPHGGVEVSFENDGKIISALESGESSGDKDYDRAHAALIKAETYYEKRGGGKIADTEKEIFRLKEKLSEAEKSASRKEELEKKLNKLLAESEDIKAKINDENKKQGANIINEDISHFRHKIAQNISKLKSIPTKEELITLSELTDSFRMAQRLEDEKESAYVSPEDKEKIAKFLKRDGEAKNGKYRYFSVILLIISLLFFAAAFIKSIYPLAVLGALLLLAAMYFILDIPYKNQRKSLEREADILSQEITGRSGDTGLLRELYHSADKRKTELKLRADEAYRALSEFAARFSDADPCEAYVFLNKTLNEIESCKENIARYEKRLSELGIDVVYSPEKTALLGERERALADEILALQRELISIEEKNLNISELRYEYEKEKHTLRRLKDEFFILKEAELSLIKAKESLKSRYSGKIRELFSEYIKMLSSPWEAELDSSLKVNVLTNGETHPFDDFSSGERDLFGLALRFAVLGAIYSSETPPVILDDPLINLDEGKRERALTFIKKMSALYQMIYFTCDSKRAPGE